MERISIVIGVAFAISAWFSLAHHLVKRTIYSRLHMDRLVNEDKKFSDRHELPV